MRLEEAGAEDGDLTFKHEVEVADVEGAALVVEDVVGVPELIGAFVLGKGGAEGGLGTGNELEDDGFLDFGRLVVLAA